MAGDWIKVEHATLDKPEIAIAAEVLGIPFAEAFYTFIRYWVWLDQNLDESCPGSVRFVSRRSLENMLKCAGFAAILERIGWAVFDDKKQILSVVNWDRHNGKSAKSRASDQKRKSLERHGSVQNLPDKTRTREEKRRVSIYITDAFAISERVKAWAQQKGHTNLEAHLEHFVGYAVANGKGYVDPDQALMNAIRENWAKVGQIKVVHDGTPTAGWWLSEAATVAKGKELGLLARGGETMNDFRGRIHVALAKGRKHA